MSPTALTGAGNVTTSTAASTATNTTSKPSSVADGDTLWAVLDHRASSASWSTVPTGWTQRFSDNSNSLLSVFSKPIPSAAAETATSYSWVASVSAVRTVGTIFRVTGANLSAPLDAVGAFVGTGTTSIIDPAVTAGLPGTLLLAIFVAFSTTTTPAVVGTPSGMTEVGHVSYSPSGSTYLEIAQQALSSTGSTGTRTGTITSGTAASVSGVMLTVGAPTTLAASLSAAAGLTASASLGAANAASLSAAVNLTSTAKGALGLAASLSGAATLTANQAAAPLNVLRSDGTWAPVVQHVLRGGSWVS
jgi:hypothetical protein